MPDNVYSVSEIVGSSTVSIDDAVRGAIDRA
ncbi:MAG: dodecin domain-containing protein, partial [Acidimicrobiaceae bacterium]|nr:dodecin domain-containing protein [Acidimicrobiaceae bacterium]